MADGAADGRGSTSISHRELDVRGLRMHIAEAGPAQGPLVVLLHGFPESWYSWRHQLTALAGAGFHAVAPDQRGYGQTGRPSRVDEYTILHLAGDVTGLLDALGEPDAVVVGHDWGAPVAWHVALLRPDRVRGVAALSVPWRPRGSAPPVAVMRERFGEAFYMVYFQQLGPADAELARDPRLTFRKTLYSASGDSQGPPWLVPAGGGLLDAFADPAELPGWLTEADIGYFAGQFTASGFTGGLNWYRNLDRNWELTSAWHGAPITPPALFIAGERDGVIAGPGARTAIDRMAESVPGLRGTVLLPGCGHWTQQERPDEVSEALISFADGAR